MTVPHGGASEQAVSLAVPRTGTLGTPIAAASAVAATEARSIVACGAQIIAATTVDVVGYNTEKAQEYRYSTCALLRMIKLCPLLHSKSCLLSHAARMPSTFCFSSRQNVRFAPSCRRTTKCVIRPSNAARSIVFFTHFVVIKMASDEALLAGLGMKLAEFEAPGAAGTEDPSALRRRLMAAIDAPLGGRSEDGEPVLPSGGPSPVETAARSLVLAVSAELDDVRPNAEFARLRLDQILDEELGKAGDETAAAALRAHAETLRAAIDAAEAAKVFALEAELVGADAALERCMADVDALRSAIERLSDAALVAASFALAARTRSLLEAARGAPTGPIAEATLLLVPSHKQQPTEAAGAAPPFASLLTAHVTLDDVRVMGAVWDGCTCAAGAPLVAAQVRGAGPGMCAQAHSPACLLLLHAGRAPGRRRGGPAPRRPRGPRKARPPARFLATPADCRWRRRSVSARAPACRHHDRRGRH